MTTIGIIGSGMSGPTWRKWRSRGYDVVLSGSGKPEALDALIGDLGPSARAATPEEAAQAARHRDRRRRRGG